MIKFVLTSDYLLSLIVSRTSITTHITVALTFHRFITWNLRFSYFSIFLFFNQILLCWCYDPLAPLYQWFCTPFSLCKLSQYQVFYVLFLSVSACIGKYHWILNIPFSSTSSRWLYCGISWTDFQLTDSWSKQ